MNELTPSDNGASVAGIYGIAGNPYAAWLLGRGFGELLALSPSEFRRPETLPRCLAQKEHLSPKLGTWSLSAGACSATMHYRADAFVCYEHAEPVRVPRPPRLQDIPFFEGGIEAAIGCEVDLVYTKEDGERKASWKYKVRPL